jgi:hypothetical protein
MAAEELNKSKLDNLQDLIPRISEGTVTPIISNSFRIEEIFRDDDDLMQLVQKDQIPRFYDEVHTIDHQLSKAWANKFDYPMSDGHSWARVAQYLQVDPDREPGDEYIQFLNERLVAMGSKKKDYEDKAKGLMPSVNSMNFSKIASDLDYPTFPEDREDPLLLLARLPLPIYITTSYSNFLELALRKAGKSPRRQICFYTGQKIKDISNHLPDGNYNPDPTHPAVYYLFGMEEYKPTLVLSEDDYLDFLMRADGVIGAQNFPSPLSLALSESRLLLLGYSLQNWDFRTLFRLILKFRQETRKKPSIAIQFKPSLGQKDYEERSVNYLERYFDAQKFKIRWSGTEKFIYDLWDAWENSNPGTS